MTTDSDRYIVKNVGSKYMLFDKQIGEFILGYQFESEQEAKDFFSGEGKITLRKESSGMRLGKSLKPPSRSTARRSTGRGSRRGSV